MKISLVILLTIIGVSFWFNGQAVKTQVISGETKFEILRQARSNVCGGAGFLSNKQDTDRLQGSCCSAMEFHRYQEQVGGLKQFSYIREIPTDPYDIPVSVAKELLGYKQTIRLTSTQQQIYDQAMKLSDEGGPCCCRCWRWDAFEGLAKYLIAEHDFSAEKVAQVWDLEDGCGGSGHVEHT